MNKQIHIPAVIEMLIKLMERILSQYTQCITILFIV